MRSRLLLVPALFLLAGTPALATKRAPEGQTFSPLPALPKQAKGLELRVVRYTGGTNGEMIVAVRNASARHATFSAEGLYFVPHEDAERAPQRLGAAGPFLVQRNGSWKSEERLTLSARATATLRLQVFCIDSHRSSPTARHSFRLGSKRLPKTLRTQIAGSAKTLLKKHGAMPVAKSAIQSAVWQARDSAWLKLDGERKDEKGTQRRPRKREHRLQRQQQTPPQEPLR